MRFARKMLLLAVAAIAALAMSASTASATTDIQVVDESTNKVCTTLASPHTSGGCAVHATGTIKLQGWAFVWFDEATCVVELEMRVGGDGTGAVDDQDLYDGDANCDATDGTEPVTPCDFPWEGSGERVDATTVHAVTAVCLNATEVDVCNGTLEYDIIEGGKADDLDKDPPVGPYTESYAVTFANSNIGSVCRINGTLTMEASSSIHIN